MKTTVEKYTADKYPIIAINDLKGQLYVKDVKIGYTYYIFRTEEKAWVRHSGKLTKEEKQLVIEHENKKHTCFESSQFECTCKAKCQRNINNY